MTHVYSLNGRNHCVTQKHTKNNKTKLFTGEVATANTKNITI